MDSAGNSGSLQSSSGDDDEYDSRAADSFSAFLTHPPLVQHPPPFDPLSNYLHLQNSSPHVFWPRSGTADPYTSNSSTFMSSFQPQASSTAPPPAQIQSPAARNPKKRSRASRRAPTTVLTTDTTNFRAMVQEFTGIPAPPFISSSPFQRSRLDLFSMRLSDPAAQTPPYLRRPFAQEVQSSQPPLPFLSSTTTAAAQSSASTNSSVNYQLPSPNSNLFNISTNNNITSLLQQVPPNHNKFPFSTSPIINLGSKIQDSFQIPPNEQQSNIKMRSGFDDFSLTHTSPTLPNLVSTDQVQPRNDDHNINNNERWAMNNVDDEINTDQPIRVLANGNYTFQSNSRNGDNVNYSAASSSNFHEEEKGQDQNTDTRSQGMMESWICSSE